ncbi:B-box zinc finger protein [Simiduia sp. 21SJ11W-1]|uniref:B-box zinc finger protein n=1 Tax=Simiduia sp. 21SJ11W-1 TaxID=2909669 RepID=UPI0020A0F730|nr:B-box zinc finger protein [Simiduia sp. 21SJ11W-1]UTA47801.1 B-box zinc finger protein [Simiduia sp. 21SJ11W-1]
MKDYCQYHPLSAATFHCDHCAHFLCDHCVDHSKMPERCIHCGGKLESLGASNSAEPFWRRLQQAFRYPLASQSLTLIVVVSLLTSALSVLPFAIAIYLIATGAMMRYSFACLENTAQGKLTAPDITHAYEGGVVLLFQLLAIVVVMTAVVIGIEMAISEGLAKLVGVLFVLGFPAVIILFAINQSWLEAINPASILRLILAIGLPYGVLLGLILVMTASVSVLHEIIGTVDFLAAFLQSAVSNFYTVVVFHIMGYMIFQYQAELGFTARAEDGEALERSEMELHNARIDIALKEAQYNKVVDLFAEANSKFPDQASYYLRCFDYLCNVNLPERLSRFAPHFFDFLFKSERKEQVYPSYKRLLRALPGYQPEAPRLRHLLAEQCYSNGDARSTLKLLNGLHKQAPDYPRLVAAYELMCEALADMPNMGKQLAQCQQLVANIKRRAEQKAEARAAEVAARTEAAKAELAKTVTRRGGAPKGAKLIKPKREADAEQLNDEHLTHEQRVLGSRPTRIPSGVKPGAKKAEPDSTQAAEAESKPSTDDNDLPPIDFKL